MARSGMDYKCRKQKMEELVVRAVRINLEGLK